LSQSFPGAEHLAKLKSVGESQPSSSVVGEVNGGVRSLGR